MTTARAQLVDPHTPLFYHLVSRCVRRSWLCGVDPLTGIDYSHRKRWFVERIKQLARCYAVEVYAHTIMSNHFHTVVYYDPLACLRWSDEEVVRRWVEAHPKRRKAKPDLVADAVRRATLLGQPETVERLRKQLGSLSYFMKHLKQPIAWRANREDDCRGHFFESRFYSGALLSEESVVAAMAYVDLNPVRAKIARSLEQCADTSIKERLAVIENSAERLDMALSPIVSGLEESSEAPSTQRSAPTPPRASKATFSMTHRQYVELLESIVRAETDGSTIDDDTATWRARIARHRERWPAYGDHAAMMKWFTTRGRRLPKHLVIP